jgi:hypothetical protein
LAIPAWKTDPSIGSAAALPESSSQRSGSAFQQIRQPGLDFMGAAAQSLVSTKLPTRADPRRA